MHVYRRKSGHVSGKHKTTLYTAEGSMVYGFRDEMVSNSGHRQTFGDMEYQLNKFNILPNESVRNTRVVLVSPWRCVRIFNFSFCFQMQNSTMEKIRQHYYVTPPNVHRFVDINNNNDDPYSMVEREMSNVMQSKNDFEFKEPHYFNVRPQKVMLNTTVRTILFMNSFINNFFYYYRITFLIVIVYELTRQIVFYQYPTKIWNKLNRWTCLAV